MSKVLHMALDIRGWLMNHTHKRDYEKMFRHDDGRFMTPDEAKAELLNQLAMGRKLLPYGECEGFSYETGCPGHDDAPKERRTILGKLVAVEMEEGLYDKLSQLCEHCGLPTMNCNC